MTTLEDVLSNAGQPARVAVPAGPLLRHGGTGRRGVGTGGRVSLHGLARRSPDVKEWETAHAAQDVLEESGRR